MHKSFEILPINISTVRLSDLANGEVIPLDDCFIMQEIYCLHCALKFHKHEQKDRTKFKTLAELPDHVS